MRKVILIALGIAVGASASAQEAWTLRQCIDHALEHNIELRRQAIAVSNAELDLNTTQNSRLPNLNASVSQRFSFGQNPYQVGETYEFRNTQSSNTSLRVSTEMPLFEGFRINNQVKVDRLNLEAAVAGLEKARESLELNVAGLYLDVLFKKEILAVKRQQTALTQEQVENTTKMVESGKAARAQLYEIEAKLAQDRLSETNAAGDLDLALLNLTQALDLEHSADFDIVEPSVAELDPESWPALRSPDTVYETALGIKPSVRQAELRLEGSRRAVQVAKSAYWPSLSLGADFSDGYEYMFGQAGQQSFADQIRNRHSEGIGLNLSIPIFNRNATRNRVRAARLGEMSSSLELEGVRLALYKEIQQAWQRAQTARARYDATSLALSSAEESFRAMELRYTGGKATVYEYSQAGELLFSSRSEQAQAKFDFLFRTKILDFYTGERIDL